MSDYLVRGMSMDGFVKVAAICSTELVRRGAQIQKTTPNATAAFGRALTAASMMGNMQKVENGSMTLQIRGGGPIGTITVVSDAVGNVRGCVTEPNVPLVEKYPGKLDVGATVGTDGTLTVIRDLQMKEPYIGSVQLVSGEIGDDVTAYFVQSEQVPTACALGVLVDRDHSVKVAGQEAPLTPKEFDLLVFLVSNKGIALSREKILQKVWNYDYYGEDRTVDTHIKMLRGHLGHCRSYIVTVWGIGYKFDPDTL